MDPNATVKELRELCEEIAEALDNGADAGDINAEARFVELFQGLDEWMSKGGFLPEAWVSTSRLIAKDEG